MEPYSNHTTTAGTFHWATNATLFSSAETDEEFCALIKSVEGLVLTITYTIIFCLSVIGNSVVIVTIVQQRSMRTITNLYLVIPYCRFLSFCNYDASSFQLNLALTDLLLSVICMPPTLVQSLFHCWIFGPVLCKVFAYLQRKSMALRNC
jgi:cholecystokinin A receptor